MQSDRTRPKIRAEVSVTNVVITFSLGRQINLKFCGSIPNTSARLGQFPALQVYFKMPDGRHSTVLVFRTATVTVPGSRSEVDALLCAQRVRLFFERRASDNYKCFGWPTCGRLTREQGTYFDFRNYRTVNVVTTIRTNRGIDLDALAQDTDGHTIYQPDLFSAAKYRPNDKHIFGTKINFFETRAFNVMGAQDLEQAIAAARCALERIYKHWRDDVHPHPNARYISRLRRFSANTSTALECFDYCEPLPLVPMSPAITSDIVIANKSKRKHPDNSPPTNNESSLGDDTVGHLSLEYGMAPSDFINNFVNVLENTI